MRQWQDGGEEQQEKSKTRNTRGSNMKGENRRKRKVEDYVLKNQTNRKKEWKGKIQDHMMKKRFEKRTKRKERNTRPCVLEG